jgi:hypothetical protein
LPGVLVVAAEQERAAGGASKTGARERQGGASRRRRVHGRGLARGVEEDRRPVAEKDQLGVGEGPAAGGRGTPIARPWPGERYKRESCSPGMRYF